MQFKDLKDWVPPKRVFKGVYKLEFKALSDYAVKLFNLKITDFVIGGECPVKMYRGCNGWCDKSGERIVCHIFTLDSIIHEGVHALFEESRRKNKIRTIESLEEVAARIVEFNIKGLTFPICYANLKNELIQERKHFSWGDPIGGAKVFDLRGSIYSEKCLFPEDLPLYAKIKGIKDPLRVYNILEEYVDSWKPVAEELGITQVPIRIMEGKEDTMEYFIRENITPDIENVLCRLEIKGNTVKITEQLDRKLYENVNKVLERLGGKWNRSVQAHIFPSDPTERINSVLTAGKLEPKIKTGYFPTPSGLARRMVEMLELKPGDKVLEPSAGQGGILDQIPKGTQVIIGEILPENIQILKEKGYTVNFDNFLGVEIGGITKVIMNPPFENQQDIEHVTHALRMLQPGGMLVSVMSPGIKFRDNKKTTEFIEMLDRDYYHEIIDLPEGSFKESGTGVNAVLLKVTKPMSTPSTVSGEFVADTTKVNPELAARSHMGTSWDPEKRAQQEIQGFAGYVQEVYDNLKPYAKTEAQKAFLDTEIKRFQDSFAKYYNELLARKGQTMSTFITGGSGFNVRRAEKANAAESSKYNEMIEFRDRAKAAIIRELKKMAVEEAGGEVAVLKNKIALAEKLQEMMVEANKIIRKKAEPGMGGVSKHQQLINMGFTERQAIEAMTPDYMRRIGFPAFALSNNSANIRRMKERLIELERKEATPSADIEFEGGLIKDNAAEDRVQILFDKKPEQALIEKLKGEGWRWSPSSGSWQRKRTDQAMRSAERILGIKITRERFVPVKIDPARALYEAIQREKGETAGVKTANFISIIEKLDNLPLRQQEVNRAKLLLSSLPNLTFDELIAMEKTVKRWGVTVPQIKDEIEAIYKEYLELRKSERGQFVSTAPDKLVTIIEKEYDKPVIPKQGAAPIIPAPQLYAAPVLRWVYGTKDLKWYLVGQEDRDYAHGISQERMKIIGQDAAKAEYLSPSFAAAPAVPEKMRIYVPPKFPPMLYPAPEVKKYTTPRYFKKGTIARNIITNETFVLQTDVEALQQDKNAEIWKTNDVHGYLIYLEEQRPAPITKEPPKISSEDMQLLKSYEKITDYDINKRITLNQGKLKVLAARKLPRIEKGQYGTMGSAYIEQERLGISQEISRLYRIQELRELTAAQARPEIWKLTQEEYWRAGAGGKAFEGRGSSDYNHKQAVFKAVSKGKPVPAEVLKNYPDIVPPLRKENEEILAKIRAEREQIRAAERAEENMLNAELNKLPPALKRHAETEITSTLHLPETHKDYRNRFVIALGKVRSIAFAHLPKAEKQEVPVITAPKVQTIHDVKQQVIQSIREAMSMGELKQILKGFGFLPLPEPDKRQLLDLYQVRLSELAGELTFGQRITEEETKKRKAPRKVTYVPGTSRRLEEFGIRERIRGYGYA